MIKHRSISIAVTAFAIFFLTFLGMRLAFLDPHAKPKPRPRAVLKLLSKAPTTAVEITKELQQQTADILTVYNYLPVIAAGFLLSASPQCFNPLTAVADPNGRSPPGFETSHNFDRPC